MLIATRSKIWNRSKECRLTAIMPFIMPTILHRKDSYCCFDLPQDRTATFEILTSRETAPQNDESFFKSFIKKNTSEKVASTDSLKFGE